MLLGESFDRRDRVRLDGPPVRTADCPSRLNSTLSGNEPADGSVGLLDMTPYGRGEGCEDNPPGVDCGAVRVLTGSL